MNAVKKLEFVKSTLTTLLRDRTIRGEKWLILGLCDVRDDVHNWLKENEATNPMSPDYEQLSRPSQFQLASDVDRDSAGQGAGPLEPRIRTLPRRAHGCGEGCDCPKCAMIQEAYERADVLHQETY